MGIQKPFLDSFTTKELMEFIDRYTEDHVVPQMSNHFQAECGASCILKMDSRTSHVRLSNYI